jgi:hypothetical protein
MIGRVTSQVPGRSIFGIDQYFNARNARRYRKPRRGESNARLRQTTISPRYLTKDIAKNRPFKNPKSGRNCLKMAKTVDIQPHQTPKTRDFDLKICVPYQQISADCSLS